MGLFSDIGLGSIGGSIDGAFNGVFDGVSDLYHTSIDTTKNLSNAGGNLAKNVSEFLSPGTLTLILYIGGALFLYKVYKS